MNFTRCDLIKGIERYIDAAGKRCVKLVSIPLDDFLLAMQYDQRGGANELTAVLQEICEVCGCSWIIESANHQHVIAFRIAQGGSFQM